MGGCWQRDVGQGQLILGSTGSVVGHLGHITVVMRHSISIVALIGLVTVIALHSSYCIAEDPLETSDKEKPKTQDAAKR
ncbi:unnamed protein product [Haemonchus placei]|uniref:Transmembrane protein n=1 Tax=Haemonchus placei TaxID=6290 RepID=A0A0N4WKG9_HAEPC|nr:unnamed protein product [Haemonchus placei]